MDMVDTRATDIRNLPGSGLTAALAMTFLYAPILFLVLYSCNAGRSIISLDGLSWRWYRAVLANEEIAGAALNSVMLAVIAANVATIMATAAALAMVRVRVRRKAAVYAIHNFPLMVRGIVTVIASLIFFSTVGLDLGFHRVAGRLHHLIDAVRPGFDRASRPHLFDAAPWHHARGQRGLIPDGSCFCPDCHHLGPDHPQSKLQGTPRACPCRSALDRRPRLR